VQRNLKNTCGAGRGLLFGLCGLTMLAGLRVSPALADSDRPIIEHRSAAVTQLQAAPQAGQGIKIAEPATPAKKTRAAARRKIDPAPASPEALPQAEHARLDADKPAAGAKKAQAGKRKAADKGGQYFVEFRSRYALSYGHTFLVHGRLNAKGEVAQLTPEFVAGLHPAGAGSELWTVGHVVFVPSETGPSDGDLEEEYVSARYRVLLSEADYRVVAAHIRNKQKNSPLWHAVFLNCNAWVGQIAQFMGLKAPANSMLYPADYINNLKEINGGQQHVALSAAASSSGAESYMTDR
jgi:hypothetical protein